MKINEAAAWLHKGNIIFYPTEAVYGVGADPMNQAACASILDIKGRSSSAGFIIIASELQQLSSFIDSSVMSQLVHLNGPNTPLTYCPKASSAQLGWLDNFQPLHAASLSTPQHDCCARHLVVLLFQPAPILQGCRLRAQNKP